MRGHWGPARWWRGRRRIHRRAVARMTSNGGGEWADGADKGGRTEVCVWVGELAPFLSREGSSKPRRNPVKSCFRVSPGAHAKVLC
jgi:hypothetical protein